MDASGENNDDHNRTIIHIDLDCFYAQVEMIKNPDLASQPLGIQQKNIVVTSNYVARQFGIKKCMLISEAQKLCPNLILVKGEDLHDYRQISYQVTSHLQKFSPYVERLGLDENYIDVSELVNWRSKFFDESVKPVGHTYGETNEICDCGCFRRLSIGSVIAQEMRDALKEEFKLTSCAGISHNKLLAKLVGATHKPNQQTTLLPNNTLELMCSLKSVIDIPSIGRVLGEMLQTANITTVMDVHNVDYQFLSKLLGEEKGKLVQNLSYGIDRSIVKATGKPQSIGLEDSCKPITGMSEIKEKLSQLLKRLMILVTEDGRLPRTIRLTVRKHDNATNTSQRETKQCNISPSLFIIKDNSITLSEKSAEKLMVSIMNLLGRIVKLNRPYHITLLGLSFTKFLERMMGKCSIKSYLRKSVEVQSVTNIENKNYTCTSMDCSPGRNDVNTDGSESEVEPSPKKSKHFSIFARRRFLASEDCPSPSKLRVADLHLGNDKPSISVTDIHCPPNVDIDVFKELPTDIQKELWDQYKRNQGHSAQQHISKPKPNTLLNYFVKNC